MKEHYATALHGKIDGKFIVEDVIIERDRAGLKLLKPTREVKFSIDNSEFNLSVSSAKELAEKILSLPSEAAEL